MLLARRNRLRPMLWLVALLFVAVIFYRWIPGRFLATRAITAVRAAVIIIWWWANTPFKR